MVRPVPYRGTGPLSQHFLLSAAARTSSLTRIMQMTDDEARDTFKAHPLVVHERRAFLPALRLPDHLHAR
jgi:hypothetical protein